MNSPAAKPDLLLLPGMMCDLRLWADVADALDRQAALHYGDLSQDASIDAMAARVLDSAPRRFHLCGFSMGGYVARKIVAMAPDRVQSLILMNTSSVGSTPEDMSRRRDMARLVAERPFNSLTKANLRKSVHPERAGDAALLDRIQAMALDLGKDAFMRQLTLERADSGPTLGTIACPTLVITCEDDLLRTVAESRTLAEGIAGARLEIVTDCGHMTPLERPAELSALLSDWIQTCPTH
jgi:pimeloyl-ACP methyl ester carboxylesterase